LQKASREERQLKRVDNSLELSLYGDELATAADIASGIGRLRIAFPRTGDDFFNLLAERVVEKDFTGEQLRDAVNRVIDTFKYKELNISDVIQFDRRVKLYSYNEMCHVIYKESITMDDFEMKKIDGKNYWIRKSDIVNLGIKL
jgi:hypothetical protein